MAARRGPHRSLFDLWSTFYDAPLVQRLTYRPEQDAVLIRLREVAPKRVLDIGCGTGQLAARVRGELGPSVVGCDFSDGMLARARARDRSVGWVRGDAGQLPFADGRFDAVVSTEAFHWFPNPRGALAELHRVLVPDGHLLISLVNPPLEIVSRAFLVGSRLVGEPFRWPTRERMRGWVEGAGFRVDEQRRVFRLPAGLALPSVLTVATRKG
jgi:ubiquinone/menaquinone biosynthesis C-methylase UbiE